MELDRAGVLPLDPVQSSLRPDELLGRGRVGGLAEDDERRIPEKQQPAAGSKQARCLGDPEIRVGPDRRAVLGEGEVERGVRKRHGLGDGFDERELEPELRLQLAGGGELGRCRIDPDRPGAAAREPGRKIGRATAELDDVETLDVADDVNLRLGNREDAPVHLLLRPGGTGGLSGVRRVRLRPGFDVPRDVVRGSPKSSRRTSTSSFPTCRYRTWPNA